MKASIVAQLIELNRQFYLNFAGAYSRSRMVLQPGIPRAIGQLGEFQSLLDLGAGDGRVGWAIADGMLDRRVERYVGVDSSPDLLNQRGTPPGDSLASWQAIVADFTELDWERGLHLEANTFDAAICLSALHHVPSRALRVRVVRSIHSLLVPGGRLALSVWQITHHERFRKKLADWSTVGIKPEQVEPGDYLVNWQREGEGVRFVHEFVESELTDLLNDCGFQIVDVFRSDGQTNDLGLYVIAERVKSDS